MKKRLIFGWLLFCCTSLGIALEIEEGNVRLIIYEDSGRFNVFIKEKEDPKKSFSFFVKDDPRTTFLQILLDNSIYTMGESPQTRQKIEKTGNGARLIWSMPKVKVTQEFVFLKSTDSPLGEGIKLIITIENASEEKCLLGLRYLFDTYLGEKSLSHFLFPSNFTLAKEASWPASSVPAYWISPLLRSKYGEGLLMITDPNYVTRPDRVVFANWKRLYEAVWDYQKVSGLDFNYHPYSINDSAVCHYYNPQMLAPQAKRQIVLLLGNSASYSLPKATIIAEQNLKTSSETDRNKLNALERPGLPEGSTSANLSEDLAVANPELPPIIKSFTGSITKSLTPSNYDFVRQQLRLLDEFIENITQKLKAGQPVSQEELSRYHALIVQLEASALAK